MGQVCEHTCGTPGSVIYPTRDGNQLLGLVCCRVRVRICHSQAQLCMVEQIQLRYGCRIGLRSVSFTLLIIWVLTNIWIMNRHCTVAADYFLRAPAAQRGLSSQLVGQFCLHEQCVFPPFLLPVVLLISLVWYVQMLTLQLHP